VTDKFNKQLRQTEAFFTSMGLIFDNMPVPSLNPLVVLAERRAAKLFFFKSQIGTDKPYDLKKEGNGFSKVELGGSHADYYGVSLKFDDFGNINYGVAARALGLTRFEAVAGAGLYQTFSSKTPDWGNPLGFFDERTDTPMIIFGFNMIVPQK
jgi:hypothetical protein